MTKPVHGASKLRKRWTHTDEEIFKKMFDEGYTAAQIAKRLKRTPNAIELHAYQLDISFANMSKVVYTDDELWNLWSSANNTTARRLNNECA